MVQSPPAGLSPRVRGNRFLRHYVPRGPGSIPACAGEPPARPGRNHPPRVYPRVCGGTMSAWPAASSEAGLSPRVRGNLHQAVHGVAREGSIPACAGEPRSRWSRWSTWRVYPRVCGGTVTAPGPTSGWAGLSPRVRGNRSGSMPRSSTGRSIPACAGEPTVPLRPARTGGVYPRVCGGTDDGNPDPFDQEGLSPRVRGNRSGAGAALRCVGSIPACAGEPLVGQVLGGGGRVYPRVCGGTSPEARSMSSIEGLSPRVRGNRSHRSRDEPIARSIPACAGEPRYGPP